MIIYKIWKRGVALCLVAVLLLGLCPVRVRAASRNDSLTAAIRQQVESLAKSVYYADADGDAAMALALRGVTGQGKKLSVGKNHSLTATMLNSNQLQEYLVKALSVLIRYMEQPQYDPIYADLTVNWKENDYWQGAELYHNSNFTGNTNRVLDDWFSGTKNSFDKSLEWMAGTVHGRCTMRRTAVTRDTVTYSVKLTLHDRFDFRSSNGSVSKDVASLLGSFLFREFDWEATVEFEVMVPNLCDHGASNYHVTYDPKTVQFSTDSSGVFQANEVAKINHMGRWGEELYFLLDKVVYLKHDQPWVMEYDLKNPNRLILVCEAAFNPLNPYFLLYSDKIWLNVNDYDDQGENLTSHIYGLDLQKSYSPNNTDIFTYRMENEPLPDGSNRIYLTVYNKTQDKPVLDRTLINEEYSTDTGKWVTMPEKESGISGLDFVIRSMGNMTHMFAADYFDLRIWENGPDAAGDSHLIYKTVAPTCDAKGYTIETCTDCGYSGKVNLTAALGHKFSDWAVKQSAGCEAKGTEVRTCKTCGHSESREIPALGHDYQAKVTNATCTAQGYTTYTCTCGDSYVDDYTEMLPHSFTNYVSNSDTTCTADGTKTAVCDFCSATDTVADAGSVKGHIYESVVTKATCLMQGYTTHTCSCGDSYTDSVVDALGHDYVKGVCRVCGDVTTYVEAPVVAPSNVASTGKIKISWNKIDGAVKYRLYRAESRNGEYKLLKTTTGTFVTNTSATAGKTYYYYVVALAEDGTASEPSAIKYRTCDLPQPKITLSNNSSTGKVKLTWEKISGATGYQVYRATSRDGTYKLMETVTGTTYTDTSSKAGKTYYYKVKAVAKSSSADSAFSAIKYRTCDLPKPDVSITRSSGKPKVSWDKVSGAVSYKVYRSTSKTGTYSLVKTTTSRFYKDAKATKNKTYYYKVVAVCNSTAGNSAYSNIVSIKLTK